MVAAKVMKDKDNLVEIQKEIEIARYVLNKFCFYYSNLLKKKKRNLKQAHIVCYIGSTLGIEQNPCILSEYMHLGSLTKLLDSKPLNDKFKCKITLDIASGMHFLHSNSIYHRDLKPDNILVASEDPNAECNVKLADFGTSRGFTKSIQYYLSNQSNRSAASNV